MRSIEVTSRIEELLKASLGGDAPASDKITVFEATILSTNPLNKRGSIWDKAVISRSTLGEMATFLNASNNVPLHTLHNAAGELPVGRVFYGEVLDGDVHSDLQAYFYLNNETQAQLISDINNGVIKAVSVGLITKHMFCSECSWDFRGDDASFFNFLDQVCGNDHIIGENGVHINATGMEDFMETSLVGRGASRDANIVSRAKARLQDDQRERLAASGTPYEAMALVATQTQGDPKVDKEMVARLEAQAGEIATLKADADNAKADLKAANDKIAELEASTKKYEDTQAKFTVAEKERDEQKEAASAALTYLQDQAKKALVASGQKDPQAPESIEDCITAIDDSSKNLVNLLADAGNSRAADADEDARTKPVAFDAFKTRK